MNVSMTVNGEQVSNDIEPRMLLVHFIRETLGLKGTHWGCDTSNCGACVADGRQAGEVVQRSPRCATGHEIRTVESLERTARSTRCSRASTSCTRRSAASARPGCR